MHAICADYHGSMPRDDLPIAGLDMLPSHLDLDVMRGVSPSTSGNTSFEDRHNASSDDQNKKGDDDSEGWGNPSWADDVPTMDTLCSSLSKMGDSPSKKLYSSPQSFKMMWTDSVPAAGPHMGRREYKSKYGKNDTAEYPCRDYNRGMCHRGEECRFHHDPANITCSGNTENLNEAELCRDFLRGACIRGRCRYMHQRQQEAPATPVKSDSFSYHPYSEVPPSQPPQMHIPPRMAPPLQVQPMPSPLPLKHVVPSGALTCSTMATPTNDITDSYVSSPICSSHDYEYLEILDQYS